MTAGIKKRVGIVQASINSFKSQGVAPSKVDIIGLRKNNTLANCSCLLDYGVGEDYKEVKPKDLFRKDRMLIKRNTIIL